VFEAFPWGSKVLYFKPIQAVGLDDDAGNLDAMGAARRVVAGMPVYGAGGAGTRSQGGDPACGRFA
jgi:hypothetical protein